MALIKCRECGKEISDQAKKCLNCGAPTKIKPNLSKPILILFSVLIILIVISNIIFKKPHSSVHSATTTTTLQYNLSTDELQVAQKQLGFTETVSWFGGVVRTGEVLRQNVNLVVAVKTKDKIKLMKVVQFYRKRYEGCQFLKIDFYPSIKDAPKTKEEYNRISTRPEDKSFALYVYYPLESQDRLDYY